MACVHTGALVYLSEYGAVAAADIFSVGDCAVIRASKLDYIQGSPGDHMYVVFAVGDAWFDKNATYSTLVVPRKSLGIPSDPDTQSRWS